jgi:hypothetical protein
VDNSNGSVDWAGCLSSWRRKNLSKRWGVSVKMTEAGLGDSDDVTTVMDDGTCNKGERTVGKDGDNAETDADLIAVGVGEGDEEEEEIIDGDLLEGSRQSYSVGSALEKCMQRRWATR